MQKSVFGAIRGVFFEWQPQNWWKTSYFGPTDMKIKYLRRDFDLPYTRTPLTLYSSEKRSCTFRLEILHFFFQIWSRCLSVCLSVCRSLCLYVYRLVFLLLCTFKLYVQAKTRFFGWMQVVMWSVWATDMKSSLRGTWTSKFWASLSYATW